MDTSLGRPLCISKTSKKNEPLTRFDKRKGEGERGGGKKKARMGKKRKRRKRGRGGGKRYLYDPGYHIFGWQKYSPCSMNALYSVRGQRRRKGFEERKRKEGNANDVIW